MIKTALVAMTIVGCDCDAKLCEYIGETPAKWSTIAECEAAMKSQILHQRNFNYPLVSGICRAKGSASSSHLAAIASRPDLKPADRDENDDDDQPEDRLDEALQPAEQEHGRSGRGEVVKDALWQREADTDDDAANQNMRQAGEEAGREFDIAERPEADGDNAEEQERVGNGKLLNRRHEVPPCREPVR